MKGILEFIVSFFKYKYYSSKCKEVDFFDYRNLVKYDYEPPKYFKSVSYYGNYKAIANLRNKKFNFVTEYLEHGVCFIDTVESARLLGYVNRGCVKTIYTYGKIREKLIKEYLDFHHLKKNIITVGPYILGAENYYSSDKLHALKKRYGRILLVYPQHSIENSYVNYEITDFVRTINSHRQDFDHVFVCLYWKDIMAYPEYVERYKDEGYVIVSNGHRSDPLFLSRQKDLIMLSDMMITNGLGTHIGYSVCLNKPVVYYIQSIKMKDEKSQIIEENSIAHVEQVFSAAFNTYSFEITEEQKSLVKLYWGDF